MFLNILFTDPTGSWRWKVRRVFSMEQLLKYTQDQVLIFLKAFWSRTLIKLYYDNEQPDFSKLKSVWSTMSLAPCPSVGCWRGWRCSSTPWPSYSPCLIERWALEMSDLGPGPTSWPSSPCPTRTSHCSRTLSRVEVIPIRILPLEIAGLQFCTQSFSSQGALPLLPTEGCEELVLLDHVDLIVEEPITRLDPDYKSCYSLQAGFRIQTSLPFAPNGYKWRNVSLKFFQLRNVATPGSCPTWSREPFN